jgi:hypothetical protein
MRREMTWAREMTCARKNLGAKELGDEMTWARNAVKLNRSVATRCFENLKIIALPLPAEIRYPERR